jgi:zinc protease
VSIHCPAPIRRLFHFIAPVLAAAALSVFAPASADATNIERVVTPGGIEVWLVRDPTVPLIAIDFDFIGGSVQDPPDKAGTAEMMVSLLDEGAGELDAKTFQGLLERKAIEMNFNAGRESIRGTLRTLKENQDEAFDLLRLALNAPRFDASAIERMRAQLVSRLQRQSTSPNDISSRAWWGAAFPNHPYGRPVGGTLESVPQITVANLRDYHRRVLARDTLKIGVVGDIDPGSLGRLVDGAFGPLPAKGDLAPIADVVPQGIGRQLDVDLNVPQTVVTFGGYGVKRSDPDFMAAYVVNHILGGGAFSSRLYTEVREKRGLAYGVYDSLVWLRHSAILLGNTATRADATRQTIGLVESEVARMAKDGPTQDEIDKAKTFLKGSFALGLDTSSKIANQLVNMQIDNLGIDYIDRRSALIDAITLADTKRVAQRLLGPGLLVSVVGRPQAVITKGSGG